jgi:hypothetical protein
MDMFHKLQELIDKNTDNIPEGDYLEICNTLQALREKVKPPRFLLDQNEPMPLYEDEPVVVGGSLESDDDDEEYHISYTDGQPPEWMETDSHLSAYVHRLHAEWSRTDSVVSQ